MVNKKRKIRPRFFLALFILAIVITAVALLIFNLSREGELSTSTVRMSYQTQAVLLRDEVCVSTERYDKLIFDVAEGASVSEGDQIAQVFKWGYKEDNMQALFDVQKKIYEQQLQIVESIVNPELDALQLQISQKHKEIRDAANGLLDRDILDLELELKKMLSERSELLKNVQPTEELLHLYEEEANQLNNISSWKSDIKNIAGNGIISFYFDGNEQVLRLDKLDMLNADLILETLKGNGSISSNDTTSESPLYRLINPSHFCIAFVTESSAPMRLVPGETYTVVFNDYVSEPYVGTALQPIVSEKKVVNIIEFNQSYVSLMGMRTINAEILKEAAGISIPLSSIVMKDGLPGIMRISAGEPVWTGVNVIAADENDAIISSTNSSSPLSEGLRYRKP